MKARASCEVQREAQATEPARSRTWLRLALLAGNFVVGCGVMVVVGVLTDLTSALGESVARGAQLIALAAAAMAIGAPAIGSCTSGIRPRRALAAALLWYATGHALSALVTDFSWLFPLRVLTVLGAAVFTPQAAAAIGQLVPAGERARSIAFIFIGWALASVLGVPASAWLANAFGWRVAFGAVAAAGVLCALWVYAVVPDEVRLPAIRWSDWAAVLRHRVLVPMLLVTVLGAAAQYAVFTFFSPYAQQVVDASAAQTTFLFFWFGACAVAGNALLSRIIERAGSGRSVAVALALIAASMFAWPLAAGVVGLSIVLVPWALASFACHSAQQARLAAAAPALAGAALALNASASYVGQALGASSGGWVMRSAGYSLLSWTSLLWVAAAIGLSMWITRREAEGAAGAPARAG